MSGLSDILQEISDYISKFFCEAETLAVTFSKSFIQAIGQGGGALLMDAATAAVKAASASGGTNADKLSSALLAVEGTLTDAGIPFVENAARIAIETSLAQLKQDTAVAPVNQATAAQ